MNKNILVILIILVAGLGLFVLTRKALPVPEEDQVFCTMEAKLCPDGSYVGRSGPKCEFADCPTTTPTATTTNSGGGAGIVPFNSGMHGELLVGPTCPVMRVPPEPGCDDKPLSTLVTIFRANDTVHAYISMQSDKDGKFTASLSPGEYVIDAGEKMLPRCAQTRITVEPNKYVSIKISCDSGIR